MSESAEERLELVEDAIFQLSDILSDELGVDGIEAVDRVHARRFHESDEAGDMPVYHGAAWEAYLHECGYELRAHKHNEGGGILVGGDELHELAEAISDGEDTDERDDSMDENVAILEDIFDFEGDEVELYGDYYGDDGLYYRVLCEPNTSVSRKMLNTAREAGFAVVDVMTVNLGTVIDDDPRLRLVFRKD